MRLQANAATGMDPGFLRAGTARGERRGVAATLPPGSEPALEVGQGVEDGLGRRGGDEGGLGARVFE